MRIGTYNVLGLTGFPKDEARPLLGDPLSEETASHFAGVFTALDCDILALQEGVSPAQVQRIALAMDCQAATIPSPIAWPGHIISRFPILESRTYSHTRADAGDYPFSRTAGAALIAPGADYRLWVVNLHLHPSRIELRDAETEVISERIDELLDTHHPVIVMGDFNCQIEESLHSMLTDKRFTNAMSTVGGGIQPTMDTVGLKGGGGWAIDHIYVSETLKNRLTASEVIRRDGFRHDGPQTPGLWVHSDHLPVTAHLNYP